MELDWYSKKVFASNSARRVATLTSFMGVVSLASPSEGVTVGGNWVANLQARLVSDPEVPNRKGYRDVVCVGSWFFEVIFWVVVHKVMWRMWVRWIQVGQRLMLVKPLYKRLSSSISSKSLPATATYNHKQQFDDLDDNFLDFQPKCMSLGRSRKWIMSQLDERARRKQHTTCFACVLHIWTTAWPSESPFRWQQKAIVTPKLFLHVR